MRKLVVLALCSVALAFSVQSSFAKGVKVVADEAHRRVDITLDDKPFTSYIWPVTLKKPVLYPLIDADGVTVTRGYPLEPRPGERTDHPHHAGLWFNYSNVNGFDFWNNSGAIAEKNRPKMGTIQHTRIVSTKNGAKSGELVVESVWVTGDNKPLLNQTTRYIFSYNGVERSIDMKVTLKALDRAIFHDDKDGLLGIRVARWLESPEEKGGTFTDANGIPTKVEASDPIPGVKPPTGSYYNSEGIKGGAVWSTRGAWCALTGNDGVHVASIAILDDLANPGAPTFWHARGYGLFAANPLGRDNFDTKQKAFSYTLEKGQSTTFHYTVLLSTKALTPEELNSKTKK